MDNLNINPEGNNKEIVSCPSELQLSQNNQNPLDCNEEKEEEFDILNFKLTRSQVSFDALLTKIVISNFKNCTMVTDSYNSTLCI